VTPHYLAPRGYATWAAAGKARTLFDRLAKCSDAVAVGEMLCSAWRPQTAHAERRRRPHMPANPQLSACDSGPLRAGGRQARCSARPCCWGRGAGRWRPPSWRARAWPSCTMRPPLGSRTGRSRRALCSHGALRRRLRQSLAAVRLAGRLCRMSHSLGVRQALLSEHTCNKSGASMQHSSAFTTIFLYSLLLCSYAVLPAAGCQELSE